MKWLKRRKQDSSGAEAEADARESSPDIPDGAALPAEETAQADALPETETKKRAFPWRTRREKTAPASARKTPAAGVEMLKTVVFLLIASIVLTLWCLLVGTRSDDRGFSMVGSYFSRSPLTVLLNFLPVFLFLTVAYVLINRAWIAWLVSSVFFLLMVFINYFKIDLRGEPFVYDDLAIAGDGLGILDEYHLSIPFWFWISLAIIAVGAVLLKFFAKGKITRRFWWTRVAAIALCVGIGWFSWVQWYTDDILYYNSTVKVQFCGFNIWCDDGKSAAGGLFYSFLNSVHEAYPAAPDGYSEAAAAETLAQYPDVPIPEDKKVNLIVTMLESYSDLSAFGTIDFSFDPYRDLHALQRESYHGTLIDDSIGGGTINAERSFLTGFAYRHPGYNSNTNSFVWYLRENGYHAEGAHPGHDWFYSRHSITRRLGFETYYFHEGHLEDYITENASYHGFAADSALFGERREAYENRDPNVPYFSFAVTFQGHSPYNKETLIGKRYVSGLSGEADFVVNNYLNSVAGTGRQIAAFVDSFRDDEEPVVLVFFGDHKPTLGDEQKYYAELGITGKVSGPTGRYRLYSTPYLIWANDAAKEVLGKDFTGEGPTISPCYLMSEVFDCCGWTGPSWMQFQRTVRDTVPVLHMRNYMLHDGALTMKKTAEEQAAFDEFARIEYYVRQIKPTVPTAEEN